jgi:hypothetical protein
VTITGNNFVAGATTVQFGGSAATGVSFASATKLTATSPAGSGAVDVTVTTPGGTSATGPADHFTYIVPAPTVTAISPSSGPQDGGTTVKITGAHLSGATAVKFGPKPASGFQVNSDTQITATSPAGSGTVDVTVTTPGGASATGPADRFSYQAPSNQQPAVTGGTPSVTSTNSASFSGEVNPNGLATTVHFEYGLDSRYLGKGASGIVYTQSTPDQSVGSGSTSQAVNASVSGLVPNAIYHMRLVATNSAGTVDGPDQTFMTPAAPPPPRPVLGKAVDVKPVSGVVLIKTAKGFVPLTEGTQLPNGAQVDTRQGSLALTSSVGHGKTQTGVFGGAVFSITQSRGAGQTGLTTLTLIEGGFPGAPTFAICKAHKGSAGPSAGTAALSRSVLQTLHAREHRGRFRSRGRRASATVLGTVWDMSERCDGTLTVVHQGVVVVTDLVRHKTIKLRAGEHYLAQPPSKRHK